MQIYMTRRFMSRLGSTLVLAGLLVGLTGASSPAQATGSNEAKCIARSECCKVCSKGQACGNSCISRRFQCHKGRGCACDADEVCE
jgi:hypothetical protein